ALLGSHAPPDPVGVRESIPSCVSARPDVPGLDGPGLGPVPRLPARAVRSEAGEPIDTIRPPPRSRRPGPPTHKGLRWDWSRPTQGNERSSDPFDSPLDRRLSGAKDPAPDLETKNGFRRRRTGHEGHRVKGS